MDVSQRSLTVKRPDGTSWKVVFPSADMKKQVLNGGSGALQAYLNKALGGHSPQPTSLSAGATGAPTGNGLRPMQPGRSNLVTTDLHRPSASTLGLHRAPSVTSGIGIAHHPTPRTPGAAATLNAHVNPCQPSDVPRPSALQPSRQNMGTMLPHGEPQILGTLQSSPQNPRLSYNATVTSTADNTGSLMRHPLRDLGNTGQPMTVASAPKPFIEDDEAIVALLKELILNRSETLGPRIRKSVMDSMLNSLHRQKIMYTAEKVSNRKKCLLKYFRERKKLNEISWRFYDLVGQWVGDVEFDGVFAEMKNSADRVTFDTNATNMLIYEYSKRKDLFEKVSNRRQLWEEIACEINVAFPNLNASWEVCERKWSLLKSTFKDLREQASGDGSSSIEWTFYDAMNLIIGNSVGVEAKFSFAVGAKNVVKKRNEIVQKEYVEESVPKEPKKPRLSNAAKKLALEEKKLAMQQQYLALLSRKILQSEAASNAENVIPMDESTLD